MTQIIKTSTPGKARGQLSKAIIISIRAFMRQGEPDHKTNDLVAFVILALQEISSGIDQSVAAWEKRGYWVKADKYRLEWQWAGEMADKLQLAFASEDWGKIAEYLLDTMTHFSNIKVSDRHRMGQPWVNAYTNYKKILNK